MNHQPQRLVLISKDFPFRSFELKTMSKKIASVYTFFFKKIFKTTQLWLLVVTFFGRHKNTQVGVFSSSFIT
jgi:hypothetical protein